MILIINFFFIVPRGFPPLCFDRIVIMIGLQDSHQGWKLFIGKSFRWLCCSAKSDWDSDGEWIRVCYKMFSDFNFTSLQFHFFSFNYNNVLTGYFHRQPSYFAKWMFERTFRMVPYFYFVPFNSILKFLFPPFGTLNLVFAYIQMGI